ncbi:hypothetical protein Unana1_04525 [Umbelopsis nana]
MRRCNSLRPAGRAIYTRFGQSGRHVRFNSTKSPELESAQKYCADSVRKHDYENYLCIPFYPREIRNAQYALRAFNVELASIREGVSNPAIGKLRTQFWKDTIDKAFANNPPKQPVALALADAMKQVSFSPMWFKRIINEREENLDDPQFMTIKDMEKYAENTASCLLYLQLESLKIRDVNADHIASHVGKVIGISTLLRALPFHASQKRLILPAEVTAKHNIVQEDVFRQGHAEGLEDAVFEVATTAHDHLLTARSMLKSVPPAAMPVILSAVPAAKYLEKLEQSNFNAFEPTLQLKSWRLPLDIWSAYRKHQI